MGHIYNAYTLGSLELGYSLRSEELSREVEDLDFSELREAIEEFNEVRHETTWAFLRQLSPGVVL